MSKKESPSEEKKDIFSQAFMDTRSIVICDQVDNELADKVIQQVLVLEQLDPKGEIKVFINSPGGSVTDGFAIFDTLKFVRCPIATLVVGLAASMGSVLSLVGDSGRRFILPNAKIMIHQPSMQGAQGNITDLEIHSKQILKTRSRIAELYAQVTKKKVDQIIKDLDRDNWMTADEALAYGLVDQVLTTRSEL